MWRKMYKLQYQRGIVSEIKYHKLTKEHLLSDVQVFIKRVIYRLFMYLLDYPYDTEDVKTALL